MRTEEIYDNGINYHNPSITSLSEYREIYDHIIRLSDEYNKVYTQDFCNYGHISDIIVNVSPLIPEDLFRMD